MRRVLFPEETQAVLDLYNTTGDLIGEIRPLDCDAWFRVKDHLRSLKNSEVFFSTMNREQQIIFAAACSDLVIDPVSDLQSPAKQGRVMALMKSLFSHALYPELGMGRLVNTLAQVIISLVLVSLVGSAFGGILMLTGFENYAWKAFGLGLIVGCVGLNVFTHSDAMVGTLSLAALIYCVYFLVVTMSSSVGYSIQHIVELVVSIAGILFTGFVFIKALLL